MYYNSYDYTLLRFKLSPSISDLRYSKCSGPIREFQQYTHIYILELFVYIYIYVHECVRARITVSSLFHESFNFPAAPTTAAVAAVAAAAPDRYKNARVGKRRLGI